MFPGIYEFRWDTAHVVFLGAFYAVALVLGLVLTLSARRALRDLKEGRAEAIRWAHDFHHLCQDDRVCRHQILGETDQRTCDRGFDCRACLQHRSFPSSQLATPEATAANVEVHGLTLPLDRLYHRGHAWARTEPDGTVTVGLDSLAARLIGPPDRVELPKPGTRVAVNGTAWRLVRNGVDVRILSPVDGEVVEAGGAEQPFYLRVRPDQAPEATTHLLRGPEVERWILREAERLQGGAPSDGGVLAEDAAAALPQDGRDVVLGRFFLDP